MQCRVELNSSNTNQIGQAVELFFTHYFEIGVHEMIPFLRQQLLLRDHILYKLGPGVRIFHLVKKFDQILVIDFLPREVLIVQRLESVIVHDRGGHGSNDPQASLNVTNAVFLEVELDRLMAELHEHVVEHDILSGMVERNFKLCNETLTLFLLQNLISVEHD